MKNPNIKPTTPVLTLPPLDSATPMTAMELNAVRFTDRRTRITPALLSRMATSRKG